MYYDLNVPWMQNQAELQRTLSFLSELEYDVVALNHTISGKLPADLTSPIPAELPFLTPPKLTILRRCTLILSDPSQNYRLSTLGSNYDIVALRPTTEKALQQACQALDCDIISLDLSTRFPFYFRHKTLSPAITRGIRFEICYAVGTNGDGAVARRNLITNATGLIRALRGGRGIIVSSEAKRAMACRAPFDVMNLVTVWGLSQEKGHDAVDKEARAVFVQAEMKRRSFRGVIEVIDGGEKPKSFTKMVIQNPKSKASIGETEHMAMKDADGDASRKRKPEGDDEQKPISNRERKRRAKKATAEGIPTGQAEHSG